MRGVLAESWGLEQEERWGHRVEGGIRMQLRSLLSGVWSLRSDLCPLGSDYVLTSVPSSELKDWPGTVGLVLSTQKRKPGETEATAK